MNILTVGLQEQINQDLISALKQADAVSVAVLRYLKSVLQRATIDQRKDLDEAGAIKILQKEIKKRSEAIDQFRTAGRTDLVAKEQQEIQVLEHYAPKLMDAAEVEKIVDTVMKEVQPSGMKEMGKVMSLVMERLNGRGDGSLVSQLVKKKLQV